MILKRNTQKPNSKMTPSEQNIIKDTEIENRLTETRRERGGDNGGKG